MALSCGSQVLKYLIFITNAVVCTASLLLLVGAIRQLATNYLPPLFPEALRQITNVDHRGLIMLAVLCSFSALISGLGCCGAWHENRGLLLAFSIIMFIFIFMIVAAQVMVSVNYRTLGKAVDKTMTEYYKDKVDNATAVEEYKQIERILHCCGPSQELRQKWIAVGGCKDKEHVWENEKLVEIGNTLCRFVLSSGMLLEGEAYFFWDDKATCTDVLMTGFGVGALLVTLLMLCAAVVSMSTACCLRSAIIDRGSYTAFS
uniref:Tetraspanin n=1 Tax=Syphacia muris TaxID=451379 RepID=A0A0N5AVG6_9BILA